MLGGIGLGPVSLGKLSGLEGVAGVAGVGGKLENLGWVGVCCLGSFWGKRDLRS